MKKTKKIAIRSAALLSAFCMIFGVSAKSLKTGETQKADEIVSNIKATDYSIDTNVKDYYDPNVVFKLPDTLSENDEISVIVSLNSESLIDVYTEKGKTNSFSQYIQSAEGKNIAKKAENEQTKWISQLNKTGVNYTLGARYDTLLNGFEITIKAKDFRKVGEMFSTNASLIIGETYMPAVTQRVDNDFVNVYDTGIFNSSESEYQGDGIVVAVLDTGLDYTHSAFSEANFTTKDQRFTLQNVSDKIETTVAAELSPGLTGQDVYVNKKVPFAYDYADQDPDVLPINSEHGTHVAGIIAGKDDVITGVAPNAQLAIMKVFSDKQTGAKATWILDALEDCAALNVDVINMSLGAPCGFAREEDKKRVNDIYDGIRDAGISLITAAGNEYISTYGSDKNGSLNLTTNPDAGVVGSPSTYAAALSVASVDGVKTPYLLYNDEIIYFTEAATSAAKTKDFVDDILNKYSQEVGYQVSEHTFEYVTIPGIGRASDYLEEDSYYEGKIVLVKRGTTTFEEKVRIALKEKGAAGIIIYNNVSGSIIMSVGADVGAVCALSQDDGEKLAQAGTGYLTIARNLTAGPFMSDFSSWGPTSDLQIKPEITAHGGQIYSAIPGQRYDTMSGTSMATPNQAGATALIRQYVRQSGKFGDYSGELSQEKAQEVTALVNQLMMSTADIIKNINGLPYAVRKQGAGLVSISKATTAESFIKTYDKDGNLMDRSKFELGDDKKRTGVYSMKFSINNIASSVTTYDISCEVLTEGVSETYTSHGDTTVSQEGRMLNGTTIKVKTVNGKAVSGNQVTVGAGESVVVEVEITLSEEDKQYITDSFLYGMYVEGFLKLDAVSGATVDLNVPMLAFFGDWTEAPIFDEEYYDTNKDEINAGIDAEDKLMADAYATRVIGGLYSEYVSVLGQYYFTQDPNMTQIAADKEHIAISNQANGKKSAVNSIDSLWAGLLRNAKEVDIEIVEDSTGEIIFTKTEHNLRKSNGQSSISPTTINVEFSALEHELKNNTRYTVRVAAYIDYGKKDEQNNVRNVFEFPLYIDFQAPAITGVTYRTEYDKTTKKTKLFADLQVYDNHYAMGVQVGQILEADKDSDYTFVLDTFGKYIHPVYSSFNSTSTVSVELTDYMGRLKNSVSMDPEGKVLNNSNTFIAICYDYALNSSTFEIDLPDEVIKMYFNETEIKLSPNETKSLDTLLKIYPLNTWMETLTFESSNTEIVDVVNQTLIAKKSGTAKITAIGYNAEGEEVTAELNVKVLAEGEEGYTKYDVPAVNKFTIMGYKVNKAYYSVSYDDREIGITGEVYSFGNSYSLSMFPSESVTLSYTLDSNFPEKTTITYTVGNSKIATVDNGTIVAKSEGTTIVYVNVLFDGKKTLYSGSIYITVKDPFITQGMYLMNYKGLGDEVIIPGDRGIEIIQSYAFSNFEYVDKDANDIVDEDDPYLIKPMYIGENTITKVVIPEGVTSIESYAFAKLTALEEVVLPKTLSKIGIGAFLGCTNLKRINLENVKFINIDAFSGTQLQDVDLSSVVAIGDYAFKDALLGYVELPETSQSLGVGAFMGNKHLTSVEFKAPKIKVGISAFEGCTRLFEININAAVIAKRAFYGCEQLTNVTIGKDVEVIGEYAFANTNIAKFNVASGNKTFTSDADGAVLLNEKEVVLVAPQYVSPTMTLEEATSIGKGAFAGKKNISKVVANKVAKIGDYAFDDCTGLKSVQFDNVEVIGAYAFYGTGIEVAPKLEKVSNIGAYAFANSALSEVELPSVMKANGLVVGDYAFANCDKLTTVTVGDNVKLGKGAFSSEIVFYNLENYNTEDEDILIKDYLARYYTKYSYAMKDETGVVEYYDYYRYDINVGARSKLVNVTIGENVEIGDNAFDGNINLKNLTIGNGTSIGNYAFFNATALNTVDLFGVISVGDCAFSGSRILDLWLNGNRLSYAYEQSYVNGKAVATDYIYYDNAPMLETVDLSNAKKIGAYAFANSVKLSEVVLGGNNELMEISEYAFANTSIKEIELPKSVKTVGNYAFYGTEIKNVDLSSVQTVGKYAFANTELTTVTLADGAIVNDGAFADCKSLASVNGLGKASYVGAKAFFRTALKEANITAATYVGDFAFGESSVETVVFGDKLQKLGENPFYACGITSFAKENKIIFNGEEVDTETVTTYDVSATIKVIDDVLYQVVPNGLELVTYPMHKAGTNYSVAEGTVRITARAFAGSALASVILPSTLDAIGDRAFYGCEELTVVVFKSYEAPLFEEEFLMEYATYDELPFTGELRIYEGEDPFKGLGIVPFYMWNATSGWNNYYYGANFVDRIGHTEGNLVMVKPANGQNYETFISSQYFGTTVAGSNAATDATLAVIGLIDALPENITLSCKDQVAKARAAYDSIPSLEQKALVTNYSKLTSAESMIDYLESREQNPSDQPGNSQDPMDKTNKKNVTPYVVVIVILGVAVVGLAAYVVLDKFVLKKKKKTDGALTEEAEETEPVTEAFVEQAEEAESSTEETTEETTAKNEQTDE